MTALIRSELRKVTGTRLASGLLLGALAIVVVALGFTLWGPQGPGLEVQGASRSVQSPADVLSLLGVVNIVGVFSLIFGVTFATAEYRHHTAATTFLAEPRRWRVAVAKSVAAAVVAIVYAVITLTVASGIIWIRTALDATGFPIDRNVVTFLGMTIAAMVVNALLGVGVGLALRSQVGSIVAVLVWMFVAESLIAGLLPQIADWTPFAVGNAMTVPDGEMAIGVAATVATAYAIAALLAGTWLTEHRDTV